MNRSSPADRYTFVEESGPGMTPLIDCILLLLVFFMVTTAFFSLRAIEVTMPGVAEEEMAEESADINVYITASGDVQVEGRTVAPGGLREVFSEAVRTEQRKALVLEAAEGVEHEQVIQVLDRAKQAGIVEIVFAHIQEVADGP